MDATHTEANMQITPSFEHDCTNPGCCTFVGRTLRCDVYKTRSGGLIMRDGEDCFATDCWELEEQSVR